MKRLLGASQGTRIDFGSIDPFHAGAITRECGNEPSLSHRAQSIGGLEPNPWFGASG